MKLTQLSVFFPAYNEEENVGSTVKSAEKWLNQHKIAYEILVIDDGSVDNTAQVVKALAQKNPRIKLIRHQPNRGYGGALKSGLYRSQYPWICFTDSDGQFRFDEIAKFLPYTKDYDMIIGFRIARQDNIFRRFFASLLKLGDWMLFGLWYKDIDCGFKLFKREVVEKTKPLVTESAITTTEFIYRAKKAGFRIKEIGVTHHARLEGIQTGGQFKIIFKALKEALMLWWKIHFADRPNKE